MPFIVRKIKESKVVTHSNNKIHFEKATFAHKELFKENASPGESLYFLDPDGHKLEIHIGNWKTRIAAKKAHPGNWKNVEWFV